MDTNNSQNTVAKKVHIFLDVETTATSPTAFPWQIGAVLIGEHTLTGALDMLTDFEEIAAIDWSLLSSDERLPYRLDTKTIEWIEQKAPAGKRLCYDHACNGTSSTRALSTVLKNLGDLLNETVADFLGDPTMTDQVYVYSWGQFDVPVLRHAGFVEGNFDASNHWHYRNEIDLRSVVSAIPQLAGWRPDTSAHCALDDAQELCRLWKKMRRHNTEQLTLF